MKKPEISKIGVIGAGSWGTTLANLLAGKGFEVDLWVREQEVVDQIKNEHINSVFLPDVELVDRLNPVKTFNDDFFKQRNCYLNGMDKE